MPKQSTTKPFPKVIRFSKIIGPSFIILAFGLGSGELILWPYLTANYGLGIVWAALLGLTCQYFINMEIERYALVRGESVFVGLNRYLPRTAYWFIFSTFIGFGLPGIIAAAAQSLAYAFNFTEYRWLAIGLLIGFGLILSLGKTVYGLMEHLTKVLILGGVAVLFLFVAIIIRFDDIILFWHGLQGFGSDYAFIPSGISLVTFLAAFAYSGAGGNLNLAQSIYIKEKGYGMGVYSEKINSLFHRGKIEASVTLTGERFAITAENKKRFREWWRKISLEHALVFWFIGFIAMALLMILAYSSTYGAVGNQQGIAFLSNQGRHIGFILGTPFGLLFLTIVGVLLCQTQLGILDSSSRIMAENSALIIRHRKPKAPIHLGKIYYIFIWAQIVFGSLFFLFNIKEPKELIVLGAIINAWAMIVHIALVFYLNHKDLEPAFRPVLWRKVILVIIFLLFLGFGGVTVWSNFFS